jgi:hypothetical protein
MFLYVQGMKMAIKTALILVKTMTTLKTGTHESQTLWLILVILSEPNKG